MYAVSCRCKQRGYQGMERRCVALYVAFDFERFASEHNGDAVISDGPAQQDFVARLQLGLPKQPGSANHSHTSRVDEQPISLAALHYLSITGDDGHARLGGCCCHRCDDTAQVSDGEALLQDKACREI